MSNMINIDFPSNGIQLCFYAAQLNKTDHDDVIKWKHFPRYRPFVRGIHRSTLNSPHKGQWRGPLMFSLTCTRINGWVNNREAGDLRRHRVHYDANAIIRCHRQMYGIEVNKKWLCLENSVIRFNDKSRVIQLRNRLCYHKDITTFI